MANLDFNFAPLSQWPYRQTLNRRRAPFRVTYGKTLILLEKELHQLRARAVVIQINLTRGDIRIDGRPRSGSRPSHPGIILAFESKHGPLSYPCDTYQDWEDNLRAITLSLEHLRAVDRYGVTKTGEQYAGWRQLPPPKPPEMTKEQAQAILAGLGGETAALLATHPDRGGDSETFLQVQAARKVLGL